jgi:hypothetical protein
VINEGICGKFYSGFFTLWASQLLTSFFLFVLMCLAISSLGDDSLSNSNTAVHPDSRSSAGKKTKLRDDDEEEEQGDDDPIAGLPLVV